MLQKSILTTLVCLTIPSSLSCVDRAIDDYGDDPKYEGYTFMCLEEHEYNPRHVKYCIWAYDGLHHEESADTGGITYYDTTYQVVYDDNYYQSFGTWIHSDPATCNVAFRYVCLTNWHTITECVACDNYYDAVNEGGPVAIIDTTPGVFIYGLPWFWKSKDMTSANQPYKVCKSAVVCGEVFHDCNCLCQEDTDCPLNETCNKGICINVENIPSD